MLRKFLEYIASEDLDMKSYHRQDLKKPDAYEYQMIDWFRTNRLGSIAEMIVDFVSQRHMLTTEEKSDFTGVLLEYVDNLLMRHKIDDRTANEATARINGLEKYWRRNLKLY